MKIILLVLFAGFSPSQQQDVRLQSMPVVRSLLGEKAVLPCRIEGGRTATMLSVAWTRDDGRPVYTHLAGKGEAGDGFQERASLDQSKLDAGDVSLLLSNASIPDEGGYICQVEMASVGVELRLGRLGSRPDLVMDGFRSGRSLSLSCLSRGWYPIPIVSWNSSDGQTLTGVSLETEEQGDSALKDIRNRVTLTVGVGLQVTCSLLNPATQTETHKVLTITGDFPPDVSPWLPAFFVVFPLVVMAAGVTGYLFKCRRDSVKEKERQTRRAEREPLMQQDEYAELKKELSEARAVSKSEWKRIQNKRNGGVSLSPGSEGPELSSGNHYWEVNLMDVAKWRVGVKDKGAVLRNDSCPETGVWSLSCSPETGYRARLRPAFPITPSRQPKRVGVLLDYSEGQLTLYDPDISAPHRLYTFNSAFQSPVIPFYVDSGEAL